MELPLVVQVQVHLLQLVMELRFISAFTGLTQIVVDNLQLDGSTLSTTGSNNNIDLTPHGTGTVTVPEGIKIEQVWYNSLATKEYVDAVKQGLDVKDSVRVASTANAVIASVLENGDAIDGVTLATGDRVLLKNQRQGQRTVFMCRKEQVRASDFQTGDVTLVFVFVEEGTSNAQNGYILTNTGITAVVQHQHLLNFQELVNSEMH